MKRGLRQGCALSALIFVIVIEMLAVLIRQNNSINGVNINGKQHKIVQYADDCTICVNDLKSVQNVIKVLEHFTKCSGLRIN